MNKRLKYYLKEIWRFPLRTSMRFRLKNHSFSIIAANCIGGILYHDAGEQFRTPTINLIIPDFVTFCENLSDCLTCEMAEGGYTKQSYPIGLLGDIQIIGVHYSDYRHLKETWERRTKRVNFDNIFLIAVDGFINDEEKAARFDKLEYPKVCFTANPAPKYDWMVYCPEFKGKSEVGDCLRYTNIFGLRIFEKHFDCIRWLNQNQV